MDDKILNILMELKEGQKGIEDRLDRIENKVDGLENKVDGLERKVDGLEGKINVLESGQQEIKKQLNSVVEQTANLMEFRVGITKKVDKLGENVRFQTHKLTEVEEDVFGVKSHLKIIK